jgi:hypothetical protein
MKKNQFIFATIFVSLVLGLQIRQTGRKIQLYRSSINGETVSVSKGLKGYNDVRISQNNKLRNIDFKFADNTLKIGSGDSIYKDGNSDIFYIKKKGTPGLKELDLIDAQIIGKWE